MKKKTAPRKRAPQRVRRTNAERSAETRGALIGAAIELLFLRGHTATTTIEVAARARVSRGAMLHHFPTRVDLLIAVAQHIVADQREQRSKRGQLLGPGLARFYAGADINWEVQKQPGTIALLEIMMATRSDADLHKAFAPFIKQMGAMRGQAAKVIASDLGVGDEAKVSTMLYLHQATLRGLVIELLCTQDETRVEEARRLFTHYSHSYAQGLMEQEKPGKKRDS